MCPIRNDPDLASVRESGKKPKTLRASRAPIKEKAFQHSSLHGQIVDPIYNKLRWVSSIGDFPRCCYLLNKFDSNSNIRQIFV